MVVLPSPSPCTSPLLVSPRLFLLWAKKSQRSMDLLRPLATQIHPSPLLLTEVNIYVSLDDWSAACKSSSTTSPYLSLTNFMYNYFPLSYLEKFTETPSFVCMQAPPHNLSTKLTRLSCTQRNPSEEMSPEFQKAPILSLTCRKPFSFQCSSLYTLFDEATFSTMLNDRLQFPLWHCQ